MTPALLALTFVLDAAPVCGAKSPEDALRRIEDAYRARDLELAVACKDFEREAKAMLEHLATGKSPAPDAALVRETAKTLEAAYRAEIKKTGFPDMTGVQCKVVRKEPGPKDLTTLTERCTWPDGQTSEDRVTVSSGPLGWRMVVTD